MTLPLPPVSANIGKLHTALILPQDAFPFEVHSFLDRQPSGPEECVEIALADLSSVERWITLDGDLGYLICIDGSLLVGRSGRAGNLCLLPVALWLPDGPVQVRCGPEGICLCAPAGQEHLLDQLIATLASWARRTPPLSQSVPPLPAGRPRDRR